MADTLLDIVNENDEVIGQALRSEIHAKGLLHREIHVWFITPDKHVIFQKRSMTKDTFPGYYDATAGGHVELGASYEQTALAEISEETGLTVNADDICFITKTQSKAFDPLTGMTNNAFRSIYGFVLQQDFSVLTVEDDAGAGFKAFPLNEILNPSKETLDMIIPSLIAPTQHPIFNKLADLVV